MIRLLISTITIHATLFIYKSLLLTLALAVFQNRFTSTWFCKTAFHESLLLVGLSHDYFFLSSYQISFSSSIFEPLFISRDAVSEPSCLIRMVDFFLFTFLFFFFLTANFCSYLRYIIIFYDYHLCIIYIYFLLSSSSFLQQISVLDYGIS